MCVFVCVRPSDSQDTDETKERLLRKGDFHILQQFRRDEPLHLKTYCICMHIQGTLQSYLN